MIFELEHRRACAAPRRAEVRCTVLCQAELCCAAASCAELRRAASSYTLPAARPQVGALTVGPEYDSHFQTLYKFFVAQLALLLPPGTNIPEAYSA